MTNKAVTGVHWSFWIIGAVALIWNGMGVLNYLMQMTADLSVVEIAMMVLMPPVVALFLTWYSKRAESKGWIS